MYKLITIFFVILTRVSFISLQICDYNKVLSFRINYYEKVNSNKQDYTVLSGCVSDTSLNASYPVAKVWIADAILPKLNTNFISNMTTLEEIVISKCFVETIEPGAFSNLTQLKIIRFHDNPIKSLTRGVFDIIPSLQELLIFHNKISYIEDHAFANLPNLRIFVFNNNNLDHIKREWFTNTSNIVTINFERNLISTIPKGMFHGLMKLKWIYLGSNRISVIEGEMFKNNAPIIVDVDLVHNRLTSLSSNVFPDSIFIVHLVLSANLFNYLPEDLLNNIRVSNIYIYGNPFTCPCLEKIEKIVLEKGITINNVDYHGAKACKESSLPLCGGSSGCLNECIETVDNELTEKLIASWKERGYNTVLDPNKHQCAVFN